MKNIFLDFGTHKGEGLLEFFEKKIIDSTFEVHTFEPTPGLGTEEAINKLRNINGFPQNIHFYNKAVWIQDGTILFNNRMDHASHIINIGFNCDQEEKNYIPIEIESIDISKFIDSLPESYIICKMDIEGSEFQVLRYLLYTRSINKINKIFVEFHPKLMNNESILTMNFLINSIKNSTNTELALWH